MRGTGAARLTRGTIAMVGALLAVASSRADERCFDTTAAYGRPLREPFPVIESGDDTRHGTYDTGIDWAATRAVVRMPIETVMAKLLDHRNVKNMSKTELATRCRDEPGPYLALCEVDVDVTVKALLLKLHVRWTEEWAYSLIAGTPEAPSQVVINYQKVAGTGHIRHQCGSYVLRSLAPAATDVFLYDEIRAKRRSSTATSEMHLGILRNIRQDARPTPGKDSASGP